MAPVKCAVRNWVSAARPTTTAAVVLQLASSAIYSAPAPVSRCYPDGSGPRAGLVRSFPSFPHSFVCLVPLLLLSQRPGRLRAAVVLAPHDLRRDNGHETPR